MTRVSAPLLRPFRTVFLLAVVASSTHGLLRGGLTMREAPERGVATRREAARGGLTIAIGCALPLAARPLPARAAFEAATERARVAASALPGMGPADLYFPPAFCGRWTVTREPVSVATPLGEDAAARAPAAAAALARARATLSRGAVPHEERFVAPSALGAAAAGERGACIADRAFGALRREAADDDGGGALTSVFWDEQNPNVLSLEGAGGALRERRVTKRSFESPAPRAFGTSEYARIAAAARGGAPLISAERVQARYRWADEDPPREIEGLEISSVFDPSATGFGDLAGAQPLVVVKTRLLFARPISPKGNYYMPTDPRSPN